MVNLYDALSSVIPNAKMPATYGSTENIAGAIAELRTIRNTMWAATLSQQRLSDSDANQVMRWARERVQALHDRVQKEIRALRDKVEAKVSTMSDAGERATYASSAIAEVTTMNAEALRLNIGSMIGARSLCQAWEYIKAARTFGKNIGPNEKRFFEVAGLLPVFEAEREWLEFFQEVKQYQDYATASEPIEKQNHRGSFLGAVGNLASFDMQGFNEIAAKYAYGDFSSAIRKGAQ